LAGLLLPTLLLAPALVFALLLPALAGLLLAALLLALALFFALLLALGRTAEGCLAAARADLVAGCLVSDSPCVSSYLCSAD